MKEYSISRKELYAAGRAIRKANAQLHKIGHAVEESSNQLCAAFAVLKKTSKQHDKKKARK